MYLTFLLDLFYFKFLYKTYYLVLTYSNSLCFLFDDNIIQTQNLPTLSFRIIISKFNPQF